MCKQDNREVEMSKVQVAETRNGVTVVVAADGWRGTDNRRVVILPNGQRVYVYANELRYL